MEKLEELRIPREQEIKSNRVLEFSTGAPYLIRAAGLPACARRAIRA